MSSVTSTSQDEGFRVSHFFVLLSLIGATVAVVMARPAAPANLVLISMTIGAAGIAAVGRGARTAQRPPSRRPRARESADAALDQGARIRPRDGQGVGAGL